MIMEAKKPFLLRFKFGGFANLPSEPGDFLYSDRVTDRRDGNVWQLQLYPGGGITQQIISAGDNIPAAAGSQQQHQYLSVFLHNVQGPDVNAKTTFIVRDAYGGALHRESSGDVDCYKALKECFGYFEFIRRSAILLEEENATLLRGTLIIDVEVQSVNRKQTMLV